MRTGAAPIACLMFSLLSLAALTGCNKAKPTPATNTTPVVQPGGDQAHEALTWSIKLRTDCGERVESDQCIGAHGLTLLPNGVYQIGPGPHNELRKGNLSEEEAKEVDAIAAELIAEPLSDSQSRADMYAQDWSEIIEFQAYSAAPKTLLQTQGSDFFYATATPEKAEKILLMMRGLAQKYYTLPFPDECLDQAAALTSLFEAQKSCSQDSDCGFLDGFESVSADSSTFIVTDDCTLVSPLAVANLSKVQSELSSLMEQLENIQGLCGERLMRSGCTEYQGISLPGAKAVCQAGVCKIQQAEGQ